MSITFLRWFQKLLSRLRVYGAVRVGGALFAAFASSGWIAERSLDVRTQSGVLVDRVAHVAVFSAAALFAIVILVWLSLAFTKTIQRFLFRPALPVGGVF